MTKGKTYINVDGSILGKKLKRIAQWEAGNAMEALKCGEPDRAAYWLESARTRIEIAQLQCDMEPRPWTPRYLTPGAISLHIYVAGAISCHRRLYKPRPGGTRSAREGEAR